MTPGAPSADLQRALPDAIAIDGPAGSGKSTIGQLLAERLGYLYFDTGVMYRAVTLAALERGIPCENEAAVTLLSEQVDIDVISPSKPDGRSYDVILDGQDVTWEIRKPQVDANVSVVSAYSGVRRALTQQQRRIGLMGKVVMVGRDIGTIVIPEADLKIFLDGSVEERARRRYLEMKGRGLQVDFNSILDGMRARDRIDSTREVAPLQASQDAVVINTDGLSIQQVLQLVLEKVKGRHV